MRTTVRTLKCDRDGLDIEPNTEITLTRLVTTDNTVTRVTLDFHSFQCLIQWIQANTP